MRSRLFFGHVEHSNCLVLATFVHQRPRLSDCHPSNVIDQPGTFRAAKSLSNLVNHALGFIDSTGCEVDPLESIKRRQARTNVCASVAGSVQVSLLSLTELAHQHLRVADASICCLN